MEDCNQRLPTLHGGRLPDLDSDQRLPNLAKRQASKKLFYKESSKWGFFVKPPQKVVKCIPFKFSNMFTFLLMDLSAFSPSGPFLLVGRSKTVANFEIFLFKVLTWQVQSGCHLSRQGQHVAIVDKLICSLKLLIQNLKSVVKGVLWKGCLV